MMSHVKSWCLPLAGIMLMLSLFTPGGVTPGNGKERSYVVGNYALVLDGTRCGFLKSVEGGAISAEVVNEPAGSSYFVKKHIGQPKYEDFTIQVGFSMAKPVSDWIAQSWTMKAPRKNGSVIAANYQLAAESERQFTAAMMTETTIPAMDVSSKEPAYITLRFSPEVTRLETASGKIEPGEDYKNAQKVFLPSNFKLEIDGLDCTKVNKIDSFTVKQTMINEAVGSARDQAKQPGKLNFPNLRITMPETAAQPFLDWHRSFVIQGNNDEKAEKSGSLTFLAPNRQMALARIRFFNMGIISIAHDKVEANADQIKRMTVEMYVERMEFEYAPADAAAAPAKMPPAPATTPSAPTGLAPSRRG